jgi:hypothetical protein
MAEPLARSDTIRVLEEAVGLLRQAPPRILLTHWIGSVPFALALLWSCSSITSAHTAGARTTDDSWAAQSFVLALMLLWMNCWRSVYAGKLRIQLSGAAGTPTNPQRTTPWGARRVFQMVAVQSFFGATKLIVLPFCLLILFPWANTVTFYRELAVMAGREDLTPRRMMDQALRLANFKPAQNWGVLGLLLLLQTVLTLNLALLLAALPQLVRVLTGFESAFSRSGIYFALNPTFFLLVLTVSWLAFDPFAQAVYCLRCFEAESQDTGEDLRCGLRRIRAASQVPAAFVLLLLVAAPLVRAEIPPADVEKSVQQAMQSPDYDWRLPPASAAANTPAIVRVVDRISAVLRRAANALGDLLKRLLDWLFPKGSTQPNGELPGAGLNRTVAVLLAVVVCAGALFAWQRQRLRRRTPLAAPVSAPAVHLEAAGLTPDALPEDRWLELADRCVAEQNFRLALRALYLACLAWLGRREMLTIHAGKTNHEYETELNRHTRGFPAARALFAGNVAAFERAWYGVHLVSSEETTEFRRRTEQLKAELAPPEEAAS